MDPLSVTISLLVCIVTLLLIYVAYISRNFGIFKKIGIPSLRAWPAVGSMPRMMKLGLFEFYKTTYKEFSSAKAYGIHDPGTPVMVIRDLDIIKDVMVKNFNNFVNRRQFTQQEPFDHAMTQIKDDHWRHVRNTVSPTFSSGKLKQMYLHVEDNSKALVSHFREASKSGEELELKDVMSCYTMDVIASTGFGVKVDSLKDKNNQFVKEAKNIMDFNGKIIGLAFMFPMLFKVLTKLGFKMFSQSSLDFFCSFIDSALESRKTSEEKKKRQDFIQLVIEESNKLEESKAENGTNDKSDSKWKGLTYKDIQGQALIFILAGYDTVSTAMSFTLFYISQYPEVCTKLQEEIDTVTGGKFPTYENVQQMSYLEMCLNETMRIHPTGFILDRECQNDCEIEGVKIPKGMTVVIPVIAIHNDPKYFPEPEKFDPERFSPENKAKLHPFAHLPFGQGPRMCIANRLALMEMRVALAAVLQELTPVPCSKSVFPPTMEHFKLSAKDGLWVKMESRKDL